MATIAVTLAVAIAGIAITTVELDELRDQMDAELRRRAALVARELLTSGDPDDALRPSFGAQIAYAQVVDDEGSVILLSPASPALPVDDRTLTVASGTGGRFYDSVTIEDIDLRMLTVPLRPGVALQVARLVEDLDLQVLRITSVLATVVLAGVGAALLLGRAVAGIALRPVSRLTEAAERVAETRDLAHPVQVRGDPELARLAEAFNTMLTALDAAIVAQRRLVADASHQLQTPLTSLRTNVELLGRADDLDPDERHQLVDDIVAQIDDLSLLAANLIDLAREGPAETDWVDVELDAATADALLWARRTHSDTTFVERIDAVGVRADRDEIARLLRNLLDNAARWSPPGAVVEVTLEPGRLEVRDHGPGFDDADLPHVFERFYRSAAAGSRPGAGLGLAIVRKAADEHGWSVEAGNHPDGGAVLTVTFPFDSSHPHSDASASYQDHVVP